MNSGALRENNPGRDQDVIRFTLQCIISMFAEDIGLLPKEYFTTVLYEGAESSDADARLARLFHAMSTRDRPADEIPYFNGGLFTDPVSLKVGKEPLRALTKAAEADWSFVDPHIFGSVFQGIMSDAERHASGAHYTAREDIMSVVGPTVVEPWRRRIDAAATLTELQAVLKDLSIYRVLDPACGSGNFLYVSFRELYRLETEVLRRIYEFSSMQKGKRKAAWVSGIRTTNFFGIDNNPFAVELAKTTLNIAKKIAFEERKAMVVDLYDQAFLDVDPSLPLDNLDDNIRCQDALFSEWPVVDAIVGNPPFLGAKKLRSELGSDYVQALKSAFPGVNGDLCVYWFRRAHEHLREGDRCGLIATNAIRTGTSQAASLEYIVDTGGTILHATSERPWPGDALVHVSVVNWVRGPSPEPRTLVIEGQSHARDSIAPHLQLFADVRMASELSVNEYGSSQGVTFAIGDFYISEEQAATLAQDAASRPFVRAVANGESVLGGKFDIKPAWAVFMGPCQTLEQAKVATAAYKFLERTVRPEVAKKARSKSYDGWMSYWWRPWRDRQAFFDAIAPRRRVIGCSRTMSRPVFFFLDAAVLPVEQIQMFKFDDDYSFGVLQSDLHWKWIIACGGRKNTRKVYTTRVWRTFPWPQEVAEQDAARVAEAGRQLRETRRRLIAENSWSLRALYQSAEVAGPHPLKEAQAALDQAVEAAYGKPPRQEATDFLLEMNRYLAEDEAAGEQIQGPGLPATLAAKDGFWSSDRVPAPPIPTTDPEDAHG